MINDFFLIRFVKRKDVTMYNITEIKEKIVAPVKDWKWQPKIELNLSRSERKNFDKSVTDRKIGNQRVYGRGF